MISNIFFNQTVADWLDEEHLQDVIWTDGELNSNEFNLETAELIKSAGPWGQAFPEPCFDGKFKILDQRAIGQNQNHLKMLVEPKQGGPLLDCGCV